MKKNHIMLCLFMALSVLLTGCAGSLTSEKYEALIEYIDENTDIDDIEKQETEGAGEGERITYKLSGIVNEEERDFELKEVPLTTIKNTDTYRVYELADVTEDWEPILYIQLNDDGTTEEYQGD